MSLRTRLALLAGFAIVALVVASFVAWRLARATETFVLRQADYSVHAAARDLSREFETNPDGYLTLEQAAADPPGPGRDRGPHAFEKPVRIPPHVRALFGDYSDPLARLTAITLDHHKDVEGGFYRTNDNAIIGYAFPKDPGLSSNGSMPTEVLAVIRSAASETLGTGTPASRATQVGTTRIILVAYPAQNGADEIPWAMQRLAHVSGVSDWPNLAALLALAVSILAVSGLALITVRDLRVGVAGIETGLAALTNDLNRQVPPPDTAELVRISAAINGLASTLRSNLERQAELERELRQSERLSALGRVVAGVAHEVRNPLSAIKLKVQLARRSDYASDKLAETFNVICVEIERLESLVRSMLEVGGQQRLELSPVDLGELVRRRVAFFEEIARRAGIEISITSSSKLVIEGDENRLAQVIDNLIQNAFDSMESGGHLMIRCNVSPTEVGERSARLCFEDTGGGIPETDQEHIFEPFHTTRATGTGLGLAIARAIVEEHGGRLNFVSQSGHGASFVIELPFKSTNRKINSQGLTQEGK